MSWRTSQGSGFWMVLEHHRWMKSTFDMSLSETKTRIPPCVLLVSPVHLQSPTLNHSWGSLVWLSGWQATDEIECNHTINGHCLLIEGWVPLKANLIFILIVLKCLESYYPRQVCDIFIYLHLLPIMWNSTSIDMCSFWTTWFSQVVPVGRVARWGGSSCRHRGAAQGPHAACTEDRSIFCGWHHRKCQDMTHLMTSYDTQMVVSIDFRIPQKMFGFC